MNPTRQEYGTMVKQASPPSPLVKDCSMAFVFGGALCVLGELVVQWAQMGGMDQKAARGLCSVVLVFLSVVLTGLQVYDNIAKVAGAGTLVPITGFANSMASPAIEFKTEGFVLGVGAKMFTIAGSVVVYGTVASVIYGVIYWLLGLF